MTSRDIIYANLNHADPERPGLTFTGERSCDVVYGTLGASGNYRQRRWQDGRFEFYDDEWGNLWKRMVGGCAAGEVTEPALHDWSQLDSLHLPDYDEPRRYDDMQEQFAGAGHRFCMAFIPGWIFDTSRYLRKMEIYFCDLIEHRQEIDRLHRLVVDLYARVICRCHEAGADGIYFCEDLGTQDRLLIGPPMWRDIYRPHYEHLTAVAHACGMRVFQHSCGYNWELLDDLAAAGIDCFQFDQPAAYNMPALAEKLRQLRVALWSPIDIQRILPTGNRALIEAEAEKMVHLFKGFLILKNYNDLHGIGVEAEWDRWGYDAILRAIDKSKGY